MMPVQSGPDRVPQWRPRKKCERVKTQVLWDWKTDKEVLARELFYCDEKIDVEKRHASRRKFEAQSGYRPLAREREPGCFLRLSESEPEVNGSMAVILPFPFTTAAYVRFDDNMLFSLASSQRPRAERESSPSETTIGHDGIES